MSLFVVTFLGPSGLQQKYFDETVQDGKRVDDSPTMRQRHDDDDDSDSKFCVPCEVSCISVE